MVRNLIFHSLYKSAEYEHYPLENFGTDFLDNIIENNEIWSVAEDGRIPFISADDIAETAFEALTREKSWDADKYIVGPELFSYDEVCSTLTFSSDDINLRNRQSLSFPKFSGAKSHTRGSQAKKNEKYGYQWETPLSTPTG